MKERENRMENTNEKKNPLSELMATTMGKIRDMVDVNTIVGQPITTPDGVTLIPISRLSFGFGSGGGEYGKEHSFGGGSGAGVTVAPVAFLVVQNGNVRTIQLSAENNAVERAVSMIPELVDKLSDLLKKQPQKKSEDPEQEKA